ncbi:MAG: hypothetical protein K6G56_01375 [Clostridiales bacterium]|nr:hypothetical protein [Clostridiales bacterium]
MENEHKLKKPDIKKLGKKAKQAAAGTALAASLFFGGMFAPQKEALTPEQLASPAAVVQTMELPSAEPELIPAPDDSERKRGLRAKLGDRLRSMPLIARLLVLLPVWAVGSGIVWGVAALTGALGIPFVGALIKLLIGAAAVFALILAAEKAIFPNVPLKKLLSKKNLTALLLAACVIGLAGALGSLLWEGRPYVTAIIDAAAAALYAVFLLLFVKRREKKKAEAE